jgi:predicted translin family RNA/ssDNA-binding protein
MINKKFIQKLKKDYDQHEGERRQIISFSNGVLNDAKRAIFALHREDKAKAEALLSEAEKSLARAEKSFGFNRLREEGAYKAGVEEYVEAAMLYRVISGKKVDLIENITIDMESYLGGISDLTGELVRRAINLAAAGKTKEVLKVKDVINDIMAELVEFDMTGYLRTKYDQARTNLKKIEHIVYDLKLRGR